MHILSVTIVIMKCLFFFLPCCNEGDMLATAGSPNTWCTSASEFKMKMQPESSCSPKPSQPVILVLLGGGMCVPEEDTYKKGGVHI